MRARYGPVGLLTVVLALSAIGLSACGGGDDDDATQASASPVQRRGGASHRGPGVVAVHVDDRVLHQGHREHTRG